MERFIDPAIADLQAEYADAIRRGSFWGSRWTLLAGYVALAKVFLLCGLFGTRQAWRNWSDEDQRGLSRLLWYSAVVGGIVTVLVELPVLLRLSEATSADASLAFLIVYLVPSALALSLPIGLAIGATLSIHETRSRRLIGTICLIALMMSGVSLVNLGWVTPLANQSFREEVFGGPLLHRGHRELTLSDLGRAPGRDASFVYHQRWAIACAPLTFAVFGLVAARRLRRAAAVVLVVIGLVIYYVLLGFGYGFSREGVMLPPVAAWIPQLLLTATIILLARAGAGASVTRTRA